MPRCDRATDATTLLQLDLRMPRLDLGLAKPLDTSRELPIRHVKGKGAATAEAAPTAEAEAVAAVAAAAAAAEGGAQGDVVAAEVVEPAAAA